MTWARPAARPIDRIPMGLQRSGGPRGSRDGVTAPRSARTFELARRRRFCRRASERRYRQRRRHAGDGRRTCAWLERYVRRPAVPRRRGRAHGDRPSHGRDLRARPRRPSSRVATGCWSAGALSQVVLEGQGGEDRRSGRRLGHETETSSLMARMDAACPHARYRFQRWAKRPIASDPET
jgi:hypothetical protein